MTVSVAELVFPASVPVYAVHIKPRFADQVVAEIRAAGMPNVSPATPGQIVDA